MKPKTINNTTENKIFRWSILTGLGVCLIFILAMYDNYCSKKLHESLPSIEDASYCTIYNLDNETILIPVKK